MTDKRNLILVSAGILAVGLVALTSNIELPLVRNSFIYAKTATNILAHGLNPLPVIADEGLSYAKPVGFGLLSVPFVWALGVNVGVKVASFLGTAFFLFVAYLFFKRLNARVGLDSRFIPLELALLSFNPLVIYQFWSAHPDSLFAGLVLLAFLLVDSTVSERENNSQLHILALGIVIYLAILTKLYGLILGIACPIYIFMHWRALRDNWPQARPKVGLLALVFGALGVAVVSARLGLNPTLRFATGEGEGGGYGEYVGALLDPSGSDFFLSLGLVAFAFVLLFHLSLVFLLKRARRSAWPLAPTTFAAVFVLGLIPFPSTAYNLRYLLPVIPFVVVAIARGIANTSPMSRRGILAGYFSVAALLIVNFNTESVYRRFLPLNEAVADALGERNGWLDNLRMAQHVRFRDQLDQINRLVDSGGVLHWASRYYGTATHGVIEEVGLRSDISVRYVMSLADIQAIRSEAYGATYRSRGVWSRVGQHLEVEVIGSGLVRLTPILVTLEAPEKDHFARGEPVPFRATPVESDDVETFSVEFVVDGVVIATDPLPPYEFSWLEATDGRHVAEARLNNSDGGRGISLPVTFFVGVRALERSIARSRDDAEQLPGGSVYFNSSDLELVEDRSRGNQIVGLRFESVRVPRAAELTRAYIQFTADEATAQPTDLVIRAELSGNAAPFLDVDRDISSRRQTSTFVNWSPPPWESFGENSLPQRTPNLAALIQEVVDHPDWVEGSALVLVISGSGSRVAVSYDGRLARRPVLYVERR